MAAVDGAEQDPRNPFSAAHTLKLFHDGVRPRLGRWLRLSGGTVDDAAVRRITRRMVREMIRSGEIHVRQS